MIIRHLLPIQRFIYETLLNHQTVRKMQNSFYSLNIIKFNMHEYNSYLFLIILL